MVLGLALLLALGSIVVALCSHEKEFISRKTVANPPCGFVKLAEFVSVGTLAVPEQILSASQQLVQVVLRDDWNRFKTGAVEKSIRRDMGVKDLIFPLRIVGHIWQLSGDQETVYRIGHDHVRGASIFEGDFEFGAFSGCDRSAGVSRGMNSSALHNLEACGRYVGAFLGRIGGGDGGLKLAAHYSSLALDNLILASGFVGGVASSSGVRTGGDGVVSRGNGGVFISSHLLLNRAERSPRSESGQSSNDNQEPVSGSSPSPKGEGLASTKVD